MKIRIALVIFPVAILFADPATVAPIQARMPETVDEARAVLIQAGDRAARDTYTSVTPRGLSVAQQAGIRQAGLGLVHLLHIAKGQGAPVRFAWTPGKTLEIAVPGPVSREVCDGVRRLLVAGFWAETHSTWSGEGSRALSRAYLAAGSRQFAAPARDAHYAEEMLLLALRRGLALDGQEAAAFTGFPPAQKVLLDWSGAIKCLHGRMKVVEISRGQAAMPEFEGIFAGLFAP